MHVWLVNLRLITRNGVSVRCKPDTVRRITFVSRTSGGNFMRPLGKAKQKKPGTLQILKKLKRIAGRILIATVSKNLLT